MSLTIFEVLQNAECNLKNSMTSAQQGIGINQLSNAINLLEQGKDLYDDFDESDLSPSADSREGGLCAHCEEYIGPGERHSC